MSIALDGTELTAIGAMAPAQAVEHLGSLGKRLVACDAPEILDALARAMPPRLVELPLEVAFALSAVASILAPYGIAIPGDVTEAGALPERLRVAWLRVAAQAQPASLAAIDDDTTLLRVLDGWQLERVPDALPIMARCFAARDPRLRLAGIRAAPAVVAELAAEPHGLLSAAMLLAEGDLDPRVRREALSLVCAPWLAAPTLQVQRRRERALAAALSEDEALLWPAAIAAAVEHGMRELLLAQLPEPSAPANEARDGLASRIIGELGAIAEATDLDLVLALVPRERLLFAPAARRFLLDAHRRGVFLREAHLAAVLELFDQDPAWSAEELVRVTYLVRAQLLVLLEEAPLDDARWGRRAAILAESFGAGAHRVLGALLGRLAPETAPEIAAALLRAAGQSGELFDESVLLPHLWRFPELVIPALRAKGSVASLGPLRELALDAYTSSSVRALAIDALWAIAPDRDAALRDFAAALPPAELDLTSGRFAAPRDGAAVRVLLEVPSYARGLRPSAMLHALCESGQQWALPEVTRLFREVLTDIVRQALAGDFVIKRTLVPELEQRIFRYGRLLLKDGRAVRPWVADRPETGRDLLLRLTLEWLTEDPPDHLRVALLEIAARHAPDGPHLRALEHCWRQGNVNVRRAALELLATVPDGARGLELSLGRLLAKTDDARLLTHALAAVTALRAAWAEPLVLAALAHPEMGVKKAAAEALAELATARASRTLLDWLALHDNESFRAPLTRALRRAAGPALISLVVERIEQSAGPGDRARSRRLLHRVLDGQLGLRAVLQLARRGAPAHLELVQACLEGSVRVAGASPDEVAAALHRARLRPPADKGDALRRLRVEGFSVAAAREALAFVAARPVGERARAQHSLIEVAKAQLASWLTWLLGDAEPPNDAVELALAAAGPGELAAAALRLAEQQHRRVDPAAVAGFLERTWGKGGAPGEKMQAIALVRALVPSPSLGGLRRFRLLGALGAIRTRDDLVSAVEECRARADFAGESFALLCEALSIPPAREREPEALAALRTSAEHAFRWDAATRRAWIEEVAVERPLDLPPADPLPAVEDARPPPCTQRALEALVEALDSARRVDRQRAADRLMAWPAARAHWPRLARLYLHGEIDASDDRHATLAAAIDAWPEVVDPAVGARVSTLVAHLPPWQLRELVPKWLDEWEGGGREWGSLLASLGNERLLPHVAARVRAGRTASAELLTPSESRAMKTLIAQLERVAPYEAARLRRGSPVVDEPDAPMDPLEGASADKLEKLLSDKATNKGLAVRAVHALALLGERAVEPLTRLALDSRPTVRSAALRALRTVATREHTLAVTARALELETRRDIVLQHLASLGHGRYEPALPALLERVTDSDPRVRRAAGDAIRSWGPAVFDVVLREARRARPDKRRVYEELLADLREAT